LQTETHMKYIYIRYITALSVAVVLAGMILTFAGAQQSAGPVVNSRLEQLHATVAAIDPATRTVRLEGGPRGPTVVQVSPEVHNFSKLHVGDKVTVSYYEGIAAQMKKGNTTVSAPAASSFTTPAAAGARMGGGVGQSITSTVTIEDVDLPTNTVAFKRPDGAVRIIAVKSPQMRDFIHTLKSGDLVEVTYTESVAVDVKPAT
jgi:hypothetical protein